MTFWESFFSELSKPVISTIIITAALCFIFFILSFFIKKTDPNKKMPLWLVPFVMIVDLVNNFIKENIGQRWKVYSPWFLTLIIFIFFANISAVYLLENPTGYLLIPVALALCSFIVIQGTNLISNGVKGYFKSFLDPNPIMLPMNLISEISLPISLCLRLFGNVLSGAVVSILIKESLGWFSIPVMPLINLLFDIAFSIIQVAVFVILSIIFTSMKIKDKEKIFSKK